MDFNDLNGKLKRLYAALGERYEEDISSNIVDTLKTFEDGRFEHSTSFGTNDPEQNQNIVMTAVHLVGSLKDIIKTKLKAADKDPNLYEQKINDTPALAILTDIDNKDKHGDPLTHNPRSDRNPKIINIQQALHGQGKTNVLFTTNFTTGKTTLNSVEGDVKIEVIADIVDADDKLIMPLSKMFQDSLQAIEEFLSANDLP